MAVTPQTPKCRHNFAEVVVTVGCLWCHSHGRKQGINFYHIMVPQISLQIRILSIQLGYFFKPWWRHQMETFSALLAICVGNSPVPGEFPTQRPVTWSFDVYFDLRPDKRLSKQSWGWWFETLSHSLWRHRNETVSHCSCQQLCIVNTLRVQLAKVPSLVQIMAWCRPGGKPLSEPMMESLLTQLCVTRPQWV